MGKWVEVKCSCPNRIPVEGSRPDEQRFQCGHPLGVFWETYPGYLLRTGEIVRRMFKDDTQFTGVFTVFPRISNPRCYEDEYYLALNKNDCVAWRLELEELLRFVNGEVRFPNDAAALWQRSWDEFFAHTNNRERVRSVEEILREGLRLCDASEQTGNPIEFYL